jgi:2-dehydro-3-deoxyphosphogluconate aldolase/(4S)-4-hydroxy-2-oxoglutarate aldolase
MPLRHHEIFARMESCRLTAILRYPDPTPLLDACDAIYEAGISNIEITLTVPGALGVVSALRKRFGDKALIGAGTVLDAPSAVLAIEAGADFIVAPTLDFETIKTCKRYGKGIIPGCFSPTEILHAWEAGADVVKVFPADAVGPAFFKAVRGPLPQIRLMPTGGVTPTSAVEYLKAGAFCIGTGSDLCDAKKIAARDFKAINAKAREFVAAVTGFFQTNSA